MLLGKHPLLFYEVSSTPTIYLTKTDSDFSFYYLIFRFISNPTELIYSHLLVCGILQNLIPQVYCVE